MKAAGCQFFSNRESTSQRHKISIALGIRVSSAGRSHSATTSRPLHFKNSCKGRRRRQTEVQRALYSTRYTISYGISFAFDTGVLVPVDNLRYPPMKFACLGSQMLTPSPKGYLSNPTGLLSRPECSSVDLRQRWSPERAYG
jgi:hypothetical protein